MNILVTGAAGFIGFYLAQKLSQLNHSVTGIDNINNYYDVNLKLARLKQLKTFPNFKFKKLDITNNRKLFKLFEQNNYDIVCNMAAQAGVRYSIENPYAYIDSNITGFINILEACKIFKVKHLVYASSSSVYGINKKVPFSTDDRADNPVSIYAATKRSNELMAYTYSHLYKIPATGLRFFTVYGPWGRPDMAYYKFASLIFNNKPIHVYNNGDMLRDFTYIDDIIEGIIKAIDKIPQYYALYNLGNSKPVKLMDFIETLEKHLGKSTEKIYMEMQSGDVPATYADIEKTHNTLGWQPTASIDEGLKKFAAWFLQYNLLT